MVFVLGASGASIRGECDGFGDRPWWAAWAAGTSLPSFLPSFLLLFTFLRSLLRDTVGNGNKGTIQDASVGTSHGFKVRGISIALPSLSHTLRSLWTYLLFHTPSLVSTSTFAVLHALSMQCVSFLGLHLPPWRCCQPCRLLLPGQVWAQV
jgi:hypothetical protein